MDSAQIMSLFDRLGPLGDSIMREAIDGNDIAMQRIKHWARVAADDNKYFDLQERKYQFNTGEQCRMTDVWLYPERADTYRSHGLDVVKLQWHKDADPNDVVIHNLTEEPHEAMSRMATPLYLPGGESAS